MRDSIIHKDPVHHVGKEVEINSMVELLVAARVLQRLIDEIGEQ